MRNTENKDILKKEKQKETIKQMSSKSLNMLNKSTIRHAPSVTDKGSRRKQQNSMAEKANTTHEKLTKCHSKDSSAD